MLKINLLKESGMRVVSSSFGRHRSYVVRAEGGTQGQHVVITGGNTGIGFQAAKTLTNKGYSATLACRNLDKAEAAKKAILQQVPNADIDVLELKLDNLQSVSDAAKKLLDSDKEIDVLLNNAGVMACPEMRTDDGFEYQLGVNHLGHFLFTQALLPKLTKSERASRIVNVSSAAHMFGNMDFDDLMFTKNNYDAWKAYGRSKLANVLFTYELSRQLKAKDNCTVNCLHPGVVKTELGRYMFPASNPISYIALPVFGLFAKTPEQGAETSIYLASAPEVEGISSKYYVDCKPTITSPVSYDSQVAQKLWDTSLELTKY
eukprot:TRINITY_DN2390_c0_g1_i4.p2 TRINITY_DN2390_c0_g1~~TRINITY_DN2390_c0_g1_i4.p2  ORF type:complete len:318 (-),score=41.42 TRINITY_DN2390_c0_g1_i4:101-1054(-)